MLSQLLNSGCINATVWFTLVAGTALALRWQPSKHRVIFGLLFTFLVVGTAGNVCLACYRAYAVPRDILQDVVSAQEYLQGRPLYPSDMTERINVALAKEEPRPSLLARWPDLKKREEEQQREALTSHWVQAHPPFMTLFTVPFVKYLGILGTQIAFILVAVLALAGILWMIRTELFPKVAGCWFVVIGIALLGWDPVLTTMRSEQASLLLSGLLTSSWFLLRRALPVGAGLAAATAVSLKLIPGLILLVLLLSQRRAFIAAVAGLLGIGLFTLMATSMQDHIDFIHTSQGVVQEYAAYSGNISLLGVLARGTRDQGLPFEAARGAWFVIGLLFVGGFVWLTRRRQPSIELEFALAMTLMPLLSPIAWDHYLTFLILPLAVLVQNVGVRAWSLLLLFAVPDATFSWLLEQFTTAGCHRLALWFILPMRAIGLTVLASWLVRRMTPTPAILAPAIKHV